MEFMTLVRRIRAALVALVAGLGLWLLPATAFAETGQENTTTVTLPPAPTLTVPVLPVPTLPAPTLPAASSSTGGSLTVPTLTVPQLQVPSLAVPTLTVPTLTVPQLQVPSLTVPALQVPEMPALTLPPAEQTGIASVGSTPTRPRTGNGNAAVVQSVPSQNGLISPEVLLEMLNADAESSVIELTPPQDATSTNRLPIGTFAAIGGGTALISAALSLLRRRRVEEVAATESAA